MFGFGRKKEKENKVFEMKCWSIPVFGDAYFYYVEAKDKQEAFKKLVQYFYTKDNISQTGVKSKVKQVSYPNRDIFVSDGMPSWFARMISGEGTEQDKKILKKYMIDNNLEYERI